MAYPIPLQNNTTPLRFLLVSSVDHITGVTGRTPTVTLAKAGAGAFVAAAGAVSEIGNGWYSLAPDADDASTLGPLLLHAEAVACDPSDDEFTVTLEPSAQTITVLNLLTRAFRRMRVLAEGESPSPAMAQDGIETLNELINRLGVDALTMYRSQRSTWNLTSTKGTLASPYMIGPGGDVDIPRPIWIDRIRFQDTSVTPTLEYPLWMLSQQAYDTIPMKNLTSPLPSMAYYEPTFPLGSLYLWMIPTQTALQGVLYAPVAIPTFGALSDVVSLPPGYQSMLRDQIVLEFWPEYKSEPIDPSFMRRAMETLSAIKVANVRPTDLRLDPAVLPRGGAYYSIDSDSSN